MKRYLVFSGQDYYPGGGWNDFDGDFDTIEEAKAWVESNQRNPDWIHIVDTETKEILIEGEIT